LPYFRREKEWLVHVDVIQHYRTVNTTELTNLDLDNNNKMFLQSSNSSLGEPCIASSRVSAEISALNRDKTSSSLLRFQNLIS
jgi:hypothetical protein